MRLIFVEIGIKRKGEQYLSQHRLVELSKEAADLAENEKILEIDQCGRSFEFSSKCFTSSGKIERYQQDVLEITERLDEQTLVVEMRMSK